MDERKFLRKVLRYQSGNQQPEIEDEENIT